MAPLSLKIVLDEGAVTRTLKFESTTTVSEAQALVKEKILTGDDGKVYGLFLTSADDERSGIWLEGHRQLDYYMLRDGDQLHYLCRIRNLRVRLLDDSVRTLQVDESKTVEELMVDICARIGITNHDEYGLCHDREEVAEGGPPAGAGTLTLRRVAQRKERDAKLDQLRQKIKTDDNVEWLEQKSTLRELGAGDAPLLLKRRLFYSDRNVDARDPVQLNLLYVQARDAILEGRHPVTEDQAVEFAGIQCQVHYGDFQEEKHKPGLIENLNEYLPETYSSSWGIEKKILKEYRKHQGLSPIEAKYLYTKTARDLPTYGVTFFLVKEKQKGKKKLVPRLLGINAESILRLDEVTKEILQVWPLTQVKTYHAGKSETFTLNFGDYSDKEYSVKTNDAHRIRDILQGYIDLIRRRMEAKWQADRAVHYAVGEEYVEASRGHIMEHIQHNPKAMVEETFVGPSKIISYEPGQQITQGTQIMTVQQIVVTAKGSNHQNVVVGEVPMRKDMSLQFVRKLNRLNSNSVKIVTFLAEPSDSNIEEARQLLKTMEADMPSIIEGVQESATKQPTEEARKKLLDELQELCDAMKSLSDATNGDVNAEEGEEAAKRIADLSTQMYFSLDPRTIKRGELCRSYEGPVLDASAVEEVEKAAEDKMGKLNAAVALYLTAYADPKNVDYSAAVTSMNTIHELLPELTKDAMMLSGVKDGKSRQELLDEIRALCDAAKRVCMITDPDDHEKIQEAANEYGRVSEKLLFTFRRSGKPDKPNDIIDLAKDVEHKTSLLVAKAKELSSMAQSDPAAGELDDARVRCADSAKDLLTCATVTAPSIHEPHCQSALTAAAETLSSSAQHLAICWKPLVEDPSRKQIEEDLRDRTIDLAKALDRLKGSFASLNGTGEGTDDDQIKKGHRLKFITTVGDAKNRVKAAEEELNKPITGAPLNNTSAEELQKKLAQRIAQLNAALAALVAATSDRDKPDYATADLAVTTITELMPDIVKDGKALSATKDDKSRADMLLDLKALCEATKGICEASENGGVEALNNSASKFATTSGKLFYVFNPRAKQDKEHEILDLSSAACERASEMLTSVYQLAADVGGDTGAGLDRSGSQVADAANALLTSAQLTSPCMEDPRCQASLLAAASALAAASHQLASTWTPVVQDPRFAEMGNKLEGDRQELEKELERLRKACQVAASGDHPEDRKSGIQDKQRLQFVTTAAAAKKQVEAAEKELNKPVAGPQGPASSSQLRDKLHGAVSQLNAAVAALVAATADREKPDFVAADNAMNSINQLLPQIVKDTKTVSSGEDEKTRAEMLAELKALCDAARGICEAAGTTSNEDLNNSAAKFANASGKLVYVFNPRSNQDKEHEILDLSSSACEKASQLLNDVYQLAAEAEGEAGSQLDIAGSRLADAANALLTAAQLTAPCIQDPRCQATLVSSANALSSANQRLATAWLPVVQDPQFEALGARIQNGRVELEKELERLKNACRVADSGNEVQVTTVSRPAPVIEDPQHLKFINSAVAADNVLQQTEKELNKPIVAPKGGQTPPHLQSELAERLAQLNAAIAALLQATADRDKPDYDTAEQSIQVINKLMPQIVKDTKALSASKDEKDRKAILDDLKAMCEASRGICASVRDGNHENLNYNAVRFGSNSGKLFYVVSPHTNQPKEHQIIELSSQACEKATMLLTEVFQLAADVGGEAGSELDSCGSKTADAAKALLATAQLTAPSIHEHQCRTTMLSAANTLSSSAAQLAAAWAAPARAPAHAARGVKLNRDWKELDEAVDKIKAAVNENVIEVQLKSVSPPAVIEDPQHLKFINSAVAADNMLQQTEKELKKPIVAPKGGQTPPQLQGELADRLAQLNAAIAALLQATADRDKPDYDTAEQSVQAINRLMPFIVKDTKALSASKDEKDRQAMLDDLKAMCDATRGICASVRDGNHENLNYNAVKFGSNSGKLFYVVSPRTNQPKEHQIIDLSSQACEKATTLLTEVYELAADVGGEAGSELDSCGSKTADAAKALLATAQLTAPSIHERQCQASMVSAANALSSSAQQLAAAWAAPARDPKHAAKGVQLTRGWKELDEAVEKLKAAVYEDVTAVKSPTKRAPPPPPKRSVSNENRLSAHSQRKSRDINQEFLDRMRCEESQNVSNAQASEAVNASKRKTDDEKALHQEFVKNIDAAAQKIRKAEEDVVKIYNAKNEVIPALSVDQTLVVQKQMEQKLALAGVAASNLVASNHPDSIDLAVASKSTTALTDLMPHIVQDAKLLRGSLNEEERKRFLADIVALFQATTNMLESAKEDRKKLDLSAVEFGNKSAKLLYVVSTDVDPSQEKEVLERVRIINESASRLAVAGAEAATSVDAPRLQALCRAGGRCAGAAATLAYTAKLVAPSIQNAECNEAITKASNDLSSHLQSYSSTWAPLEDTSQTSIKELRTEAASLEKLLEELRRDLGSGKLVKRRTVERVLVEDTPLRRLACVVQEEAKRRAESTNTLPEQRTKYAKYANELGQAIKQLDVAYHRCRQSPHDSDKRQDLEYAVQNLQITLLQTRPSQDGRPHNNIVDLTEYVKEVAKDADQLRKECKNHQTEVLPVLDTIKQHCEQIAAQAGHLTTTESYDKTDEAGWMEIEQFAEECDNHLNGINYLIEGFNDGKLKIDLQEKATRLSEDCNMLRFATKCALASSQGVSLDATLDDLTDLESKIDEMLAPGEKPNNKLTWCEFGRARVVAAASRACAGGAGQLPAAFTAYADDVRAHTDLSDEPHRDRSKEHLRKVLGLLKALTMTTSRHVATWQKLGHPETAEITGQILQELDNHQSHLNTTKGIVQSSVLSDVDMNKLLFPTDVKVEGDQKQIPDKLQQAASKLSTITSTIMQSAHKSGSLARSAHAACDAAVGLAAHARALRTTDLAQSQKIDEVTKEMSLQTYNVLKTADMVSQEPNNIASRRRLLDACRLLNDAINKLVRTTTPANKLQRECGELTRNLQLQQGLLHAAPQPACAMGYSDCIDALHNQNDVIQKLSNDSPMSSAEFSRTLGYVSAAVGHSTECAAQCAYLLSIADQNKSIATEGFIDTSRIRSLSEAVQDTCHRMIRTDVDQAKAEELVLSKQLQDLQQAVAEARGRSKESSLVRELDAASADIDGAAKALNAGVNERKPDRARLTTFTIRLLDAVKAVDSIVEGASLAPEANNVSPDAKARSDDILKNSRALNNNMISLIREVKASEDLDPMTWVTFGTSRKAVLDMFEALVNSVKENGKRAGIVELSQSDLEEEADKPKRSYVQVQLDLANKWLRRPTAKADIKSAGEESARNIIQLGEQIAEDLKDNEQEELLQLTQESKALLADCLKKHDSEKASALLERLKELRKNIERGVVTRVVEDFLEGAEPLADLDVLADSEKDETKRKFLLERKIAELLAHLARVTKTARVVAGAGRAQPQLAQDLIKCSDQTELLAPMLVKAAQQRVTSPDDKAAIEHYQKLLAQYAESLANVRNLCDQAVDPMDFVQTAGETMQRMREDTHDNDPQKCAYASTAITKLANRVINVGLSSNDVRKDPELQKLLKEAKEKLKATVPPPNARPSRIPDWKITTAEILRTTGEVESVLGGEMIFNKQQGTDQPIFAAARDLHTAVREWSARDNDIVAVAKRMAVLMAKLSDYMNSDRKRELLATSKSIVSESHEVAELARKLAHECTDIRIKTNLLQVCERIPTISGQLKMLATVKGSSLGHQGLKEDQEDMIMLVGNAQNLMLSVQEVVKAAASASVKIASQRGGPRMRWVRKNYY